jgi:hypothetical protein
MNAKGLGCSSVDDFVLDATAIAVGVAGPLETHAISH